VKISILSNLAPKDDTNVPTFRKGLSDKNVKPGQRLQLEVEIDGKPKIVKWYLFNTHKLYFKMQKFIPNPGTVTAKI